MIDRYRYYIPRPRDITCNKVVVSITCITQANEMPDNIQKTDRNVTVTTFGKSDGF